MRPRSRASGDRASHRTSGGPRRRRRGRLRRPAGRARLRRAPVEVTLVDRRNFHLFQPLLYQVATGALSSAEIATPLRVILKRQKNVRVVMGEVSDFDLDRRCLVVNALPNGDTGFVIPYETLIVAGGSRYSYFGHDEWRSFALEIKSLESALNVRRRIFTAFEAAEIEQEPSLREAWLTFVVVGGGPTGVEMAGQIAELARDALSRDFRLPIRGAPGSCSSRHPSDSCRRFRLGSRHARHARSSGSGSPCSSTRRSSSSTEIRS